MGSNLLTLVRDLQRRKARRRRRLAVAEGIRLVEEALAARLSLRGAIVTTRLERTPRGAALVAELADHAVPVEQVSERDFAALTDTETPQGVLAVVELPAWTLDDIGPEPRHPVLVLDGVQDPGNTGALYRAAFALGAAGAVALKGTADVSNSKVLRASMGSVFRFPAVAVQEPEFATWVARSDVAVWATAPEGTPLARVRVPDRLAIVVGNEGAGVRPAIKTLAKQRVAIPLARGAESLNVVVAAGIVLYEVTRGA